MKSVRQTGLVILLLLGSALIYLLYATQLGWLSEGASGALAMGWKGEAMNLERGRGYSERGSLLIDGVDEHGIALASFPAPVFRADDYAYVNLAITAAQGIKLVFLWRTADNRVFTRPILLPPKGVASLSMIEDINWNGQIIYMAIGVKGLQATSLMVHRVDLGPTAGLGKLLHTVKKWFQFESWRGSSINFMGNDMEVNASPVPVVAAVILLALISYAVLVKANIVTMNATVVLTMIFIGWLALDVRWQWNLLRQTYLTQQQFAGKSWEEKHLVAEDGQLFKLMQQIKAKLQFTQSRVFLFADDEYTQRRATYYLLPLNVLCSRDLFLARQFKSGDFIIIIGKDGEVEYDAVTSMLKWDPQQQMRADLLLHSENAFVLKIQ